MKISQMLHFPLKGAGTGIYVDSLTTSLVKKGHEVKVLCSDHYPPQKDYPVEAVLFSNGQNEKFDLDFDFPVFASHPLSHGDKFGQLNTDRREAYFRLFRAKIEKQISHFAPDIIHAHHGWVIASILADFNIPYVISLHGTEFYAFQNYKDYQEPVLRGLQSARIIIALTEQERDQALSAYNIDPQKIITVKSGTDTNMFKPLEIDKKELLKSYSVKELDSPVVFLGGRLTAQKGVDTLLRAAQIYSKSDEKPITLIAGDGDLRERLQTLSAELRLDTVYFLGNQSHQQMVRLFNIADVVATPSIFEPFGLIATEALACGTPVIAGNVGGFRQIVTDEVGCLVEPGDFKTLAEKVIDFLKNGFKEKARDKITAYAKQNFSWDKTVANIENLYQQVLDHA
jgi:glycosyltransferase involved in cell wall biosynthesis